MYPDLTVVLAEHLSYSEFAQLLRRSKIFVSPLGCASQPNVVDVGSVQPAPADAFARQAEALCMTVFQIKSM